MLDHIRAALFSSSRPFDNFVRPTIEYIDRHSTHGQTENLSVILARAQSLVNAHISAAQ